MANDRVAFYSVIFSKLADVIPALLDEYACAFPDFLASDVTWHEQRDPNDPETTMSVLLWKGNAILELLVRDQTGQCKCVLSYPNKRH